jgi:hypothetical protein
VNHIFLTSLRSISMNCTLEALNLWIPMVLSQSYDLRQIRTESECFCHNLIVDTMESKLGALCHFAFRYTYLSV